MAQKTSKKTTKKKASAASKSRSKVARSSGAKKKVARTVRAKKTTTRKKMTSKPAKKAMSRAAKKTKTSTRKKKSTPAKSEQPKTRRTAAKAPRAPQVVSAPTEPPRRAARKLTPAEVEDFRHILIQKRAEILGDMSTLQSEAMRSNRQDASGDLSSMPIHMADLGSDNYEMEFTLGLIEGERTILKEIDEALERVNEGIFGVCVATGQPIGKARLRAKPWAKYCYEYTLAQERGQTTGG